MAALTALAVSFALQAAHSHAQDGNSALLPQPEGVCKSVFPAHNGSLDFYWLNKFQQEIEWVDDLTWLSPQNTFLYVPRDKQRVSSAITAASGSAAGSLPRDRPRPALLYCWIPKNACSMFRLLFQRLILSDREWAQRAAAMQGALLKAAHSVEDIQGIQLTMARAALNEIVGPVNGSHAPYLQSNTTVMPGIVITRNPYVRLLSGYLDRVIYQHGHVNKTWQNELLRGHAFKANEMPTFKEWVQRMVRIGRWHVNRHFRPQASFCGMMFGVRMQYQVKLEQLPVVYPCLVHQLGLGPWVDTQWQAVYRKRDCFYKPRPDVPCSWWRDALDKQDLLANSRGTGYGNASSEEHRTDAALSLHKYYDRETAELATQFYADDFRLFGYRTWAGPPDAIQLD